MAGPSEGGGAPQTTDTTYPLAHLSALGTLPGVRIDRLAGANGPGEGRLRSSRDGTWLSWRAPGSTLFGSQVECAADGIYQLRDGENQDAWVDVEVYTAYLWLGALDAEVLLTDVYNNELAQGNVTAAQASAGNVATYTTTISNMGTSTMEGIVVWIDSSVSGLDISDDGVAWVSPTTEATGLAFASLASGASMTLHLRRTISASSSADARILNWIKMAFDAV